MVNLTTIITPKITLWTENTRNKQNNWKIMCWKQVSYATITQKVWNIRNSGSLISIMVFFNISCFENNRNIENNNSTSKIPNITLNLVLSHNSLLLERSELFFFSTRWFWRPASCYFFQLAGFQNQRVEKNNNSLKKNQATSGLMENFTTSLDQRPAT